MLFGIGMTLAGGCVNKNLIRLGGGSVRSLVVLAFMAIAAYMTLKGLFGQWRAAWLDPVRIDLADFGMSDQSLASLLAKAVGLPARHGRDGPRWSVGGALLVSSLPIAASAAMPCRSSAPWCWVCWSRRRGT